MSKIISFEDKKFYSLQVKHVKLFNQILDLEDQKSEDLAEQYSINCIIRDYKKEFGEVGKEIAQMIDNSSQKPIPITNNAPGLTFDQLLAMPPKIWLVEQIFGKGEIGVIYGAPGCGKTFVVIDMIMAMCVGGLWAKRFNVSRPLSVAYCAGEGLNALPSRFAASAAIHLIDSLPNFRFFQNVPQLFDTNNGRFNINHFIEAWNKDNIGSLDVVVIDTLHNAIVGADENSSKDMGIVLDSCKRLIQVTGCTVILLHHTNKQGNDERGSGALRGNSEFMIKVDRNAIECKKNKDGETWPRQGFSLTPSRANVGIVWDDPDTYGAVSLSGGFGSKVADKDSICKILESYPNTKFTSKSIAESITQDTGYTIRLLNDLAIEGRIRRSLYDSKKASSRFNPWVYFF